MKHYESSAKITLYATRAEAGLICLLLLCFPVLVERYHQHFRPLAESERAAILYGFYACSGAVLLAMYHMDRLLCNILRADLFTGRNVRHIRFVRWCCLAVSIICLCASFGFPSLLFLSCIMAFLCLVVTVVGQVMKAAVELREENDLTI